MAKYVSLRWSSYASRLNGDAPSHHVPNYYGRLGVDMSSGDVALADECPCVQCNCASDEGVLDEG